MQRQTEDGDDDDKVDDPSISSTIKTKSTAVILLPLDTYPSPHLRPIQHHHNHRAATTTTFHPRHVLLVRAEVAANTGRERLAGAVLRAEQHGPARLQMYVQPALH